MGERMRRLPGGHSGKARACRGVLIAAATIVAILGSGTLHAQPMTLEPIDVHEGFEGELPPIDRWATNGPATIHYLGASTDRAFEGTQSLKLDIALEGGSYQYIGGRVRIPATGTARLTARVYVEEGTTARVGFGTNLVYPPTRHSGCSPQETFDGPTGEWRLVEIDLAERGRSSAHSVMGAQSATHTGADVGAYLDRWSLFIMGGEGKRAVVYVDDVRIEGEVPPTALYEADIARRWETARARLDEVWLSPWRESLDAAETSLRLMPEPPEFAAADVATVRASVANARVTLAAIEERGYASHSEADAVEADIFRATHGPETIRAIIDGIESGSPWLLYTPQAIRNTQLTADMFPIPAPLGVELSASGCRGEYESVTAAVFALEDIGGLRVTVSDLEGPDGTIRSSEVDVFVVKCWFQAGRGIWPRPDTRLYVPELLLKDPALVRVDMDSRDNYLRSTSEDGEHAYVLCSGPDSEGLEGVRPVDAEALQPVDIPRRSLKQFWFTIRIPEDAVAGEYAGTVTFEAPTGRSTMPLRLTVHEFDLEPPRIAYSIYYRAKLSTDGAPTIGSELKSEEQYLAEMRDLLAHGVPYPTNYQGMQEPRLRRVFELRREAGLPGGPFFNLGRHTGSSSEPDALESTRRDVARWIERCAEYGYDPVYFYGTDEARGDQLTAQRAAWQAVQEAGGKTFVACYHGTFEAMGGLLNLAVLAGRPDPREAAKWQGVGSAIYCYAFPQVGNEEPETYRRNFGIHLWKAGYDGAMNYAYQHGFGHIWNDFDNATYRDHNFTYPTLNGVVGTIQWEGFREAVDDVRYLTTLDKAIRGAPPAKRHLAGQAWLWLDSIDPESVDLYGMRSETVEWIEILR